ncbi:hypothetical protein FH966_13930 [Lentibacillus cibarius]|uniref:Uncharacterized protein n=1 Tax=Lentibacillus cibarius TaxID=2583219 RepID=A0A549YLF3_9BACI|nr:hypothetical protein [Lentibacillus cibarius]TMN20972.1 hypothetical protein FFL34_01725 [Lentibacillus cibarius]TRM12711.1 hypothetical protein FH966_13930 [Lentibacillus cibarius]
MRIISIVTLIITAVAVIFRWRYRIMNTLLAISFLRRLAVIISMNLPAIRQKILPSLFGGQSSK